MNLELQIKDNIIESLQKLPFNKLMEIDSLINNWLELKEKKAKVLSYSGSFNELDDVIDDLNTRRKNKLYY